MAKKKKNSDEVHIIREREVQASSAFACKNCEWNKSTEFFITNNAQ